MVVDATYVAVEENNIVEDVGVQENDVVEDSDPDSEYFPSSSSGDDPSFSNEYDDSVVHVYGNVGEHEFRLKTFAENVVENDILGKTIRIIMKSLCGNRVVTISY